MKPRLPGESFGGGFASRNLPLRPEKKERRASDNAKRQSIGGVRRMHETLAVVNCDDLG